MSGATAARGALRRQCFEPGTCGRESLCGFSALTLCVSHAVCASTASPDWQAHAAHRSRGTHRSTAEEMRRKTMRRCWRCCLARRTRRRRRAGGRRPCSSRSRLLTAARVPTALQRAASQTARPPSVAWALRSWAQRAPDVPWERRALPTQSRPRPQRRQSSGAPGRAAMQRTRLRPTSHAPRKALPRSPPLQVRRRSAPRPPVRRCEAGCKRAAGRREEEEEEGRRRARHQQPRGAGPRGARGGRRGRRRGGRSRRCGRGWVSALTPAARLRPGQAPLLGRPSEPGARHAGAGGAEAAHAQPAGSAAPARAQGAPEDGAGDGGGQAPAAADADTGALFEGAAALPVLGVHAPAWLLL